MRLRYYGRLLRMRMRMSLTLSMQYRWQFLGETIMSLFWAAVSLLPLWVFGGVNRAVQGWTYPEMIIVTAWFILLKGLMDGAINPSLVKPELFGAAARGGLEAADRHLNEMKARYARTMVTPPAAGPTITPATP